MGVKVEVLVPQVVVVIVGMDADYEDYTRRFAQALAEQQEDQEIA